MLAYIRNAPVCRLPKRLGSCSRAAHAKAAISTESLTRQEWPMAEKLHKAKLWSPSRRGQKGELNVLAPKSMETRRVNIVSERLCDDIIQRLGPSLERHRGCDIFDINPGASVWSRALHDAVQPRRHIMMDPGADQYDPFRKEIMGERKIEMIEKSGIVWSDLNSVLGSHLDTHHRRLDPDEQPTRNDSLLVTANLSIFPKRSLWNFDNVTTMILYQLLSSIQTSSFFQRYGNVRMLIWVNDENKRRVLPRSVLGRKRPAFEAELACDWVHEVAGSDSPDTSTQRLSLRDEWLHYESAANTLRLMEEQGIATPPGRETSLLKAVLADESLRNRKLAGVHPPILKRPTRNTVAVLDPNDASNQDLRDLKREKALQYRERGSAREAMNYLELLQLHDKLLRTDPTSPEFATFTTEHDERLNRLKKNPRNEYLLFRDNYHIFRNHPTPALMWDRRAYEPLAIDPSELYPNAPLCLLDVQPKSMNRLLRAHGPSSSRSGDFSRLILRSFFQNTTQPIYSRAMDSVSPGFSDLARDHCPSLWDPSAGGAPMADSVSLPVRVMTEKQWVELVQAWMRWPFRPDYHHMLGRSVENDDTEDEGDMRGSASGTSV